MTGGRWSCSPMPLRRAWGPRRRAGSAGSGRARRTDWAVGGCFAATHRRRVSGTPGSRAGWAHGRRDSTWQGWTGLPQAAEDVPGGSQGRGGGLPAWYNSGRFKRFPEGAIRPDDRLQKAGGTGTASVPVPPVTRFYTTCLSARPSGMVLRRRSPVAASP